MQNITDNNRLTEAQRRAIELTEGEFIVKAGAGTGKTHVLVNKYLSIYRKKIEQGYKPGDITDSILTVTFTRKAAKEMLDRISAYIPEDAVRNSHIMTIDHPMLAAVEKTGAARQSIKIQTL